MGENLDLKKFKPIHYTIAGATSGALTRIISQPLDVLKIRFQIKSAKIENVNSNGLIRTVKLIYLNEGLFAFWKGHVPAQALSITFGSFMFTSYEILHSSRFLSEITVYPSALDFLCGGLAGMFASTACQPFDVIRTRVVAQDKAFKVKRILLSSSATLYKENGTKGFFRGLLPTLLAIFPYNGINFALYGSFKRAWLLLSIENKETNVSRLCCGALSGLGSKLILLPFDTVKKHLQVQGLNDYTNEYKGMFHCFKCLVKKKGFMILYSGTFPAVLKSVVVVATSFGFYELICDMLNYIDP
ncbi:mitochondrial thiamine pyrophosphate carrier isoform X2 [Hydra vulgaris]|uniref:Mitochondrial thiamine pyrophosphate carrier isoform X2 n=1 Tax=Hydra vulgaris TaxID=6087 RepID=A0ABM4BDQ1_HYDVU